MQMLPPNSERFCLADFAYLPKLKASYDLREEMAKIRYGDGVLLFNDNHLLRLVMLHTQSRLLGPLVAAKL